MKALILGCEADGPATRYARDTGDFMEAIAMETGTFFPRVMVCEHLVDAAVFHNQKAKHIVAEADPSVDRALWREFIKDPEPGPGSEVM